MTAADPVPEAAEPGRRTLHPASLKALAHPVRAELLRVLQEGPATSTQLAQRLDSNTGTISWHLRQLARFDFIEDVPGQGTGRERWWRTRTAGTSLDIRDAGIIDDPVTLEAARWYARDTASSLWARLQRWIDGAERWPEEWIGASILHEATLDMTPDELHALQLELLAVVQRHRLAARPGAGTRRVQVALQAYPTGVPDA